MLRDIKVQQQVKVLCFQEECEELQLPEDRYLSSLVKIYFIYCAGNIRSTIGKLLGHHSKATLYRGKPNYSRRLPDFPEAPF